jgi:hypothetical protein
MLELHLIDDFTVGLAIPGDCPPEAVREIDQRLAAAAARGCCLILDMSCGPCASPELARAVAWEIERVRRRGYNVAIVSPGPDVVRAIAATGASRTVELVATVDEALARVRGRLTPGRTIRVLDAQQAA